MTKTKTNLKMSASNAPIYPNKFDATQYVTKRVANDICILVYGSYFLETQNKEIEEIRDLCTPEEIVDRAMTTTKYYNVVTGRMEEADERYSKFDWWQVLDEAEIKTMPHDALYMNLDDYVQLYNLHELAG